MTIYLKQSTASQEVALGFFVDATDGNTEETGLTIAASDIRLHKAGATTLATPSAGATHISNGIYYWVADATDTNTLGSMSVYCHPAGALATKVECVVLAANIYDSLIAGTDLFDVNVAQWLGTAPATPTVAGVPEVDLTHVAGATTDVSTTATNVAAIKAKTDNLPASPAAVGSAMTLSTAGYEAAADALLNRNVSGGSNTGRLVKQAYHFIRNKWTVSGGTLTVYDTDDTTSSWTSAVTGTAGADPITATDPS